ncbi:MAG: cobalt-precorrin-6A reductase [Alphaproteobacteria bacterium]|nr:cobalt-precorrin-6A reductase [Alphaproteobacteria bacterium]
MTKRLLILGGTHEAAALAEAVTARFGAAVEVISSLAGRTSAPHRPVGAVRVGGFGGVAGLETFLRAERIDALIDATHPFAATISRHAADASARAGVPRLVLARPPWLPEPGDRWACVADNEAAAGAAKDSGARRVFLTIGGRGLAPFATLTDLWFLVRLIERPSEPIPLAHLRLILARGPFSVAAERDLMVEERIDLLITRASGGAATEAKLIAARELLLPVILIDRPPGPGGEVVTTIDEALVWLAVRL